MPWTFARHLHRGPEPDRVPGTAGFISKWYLVLGRASSSRHWLIAAVILFGSLLAVVYMWKLVETLFFQVSAPTHNRPQRSPAVHVVPIWALVLANIYFGLQHGPDGRHGPTAVQMLGATGR